MSLVQRVTCRCNATKTYATPATFKNHLRSDRHVAWESKNDICTYKITIAKQEVEISQLRRRVHELEMMVPSRKRKRNVSERKKKMVAAHQEWKCGHCQQLLPSCYEVDHVVPLWQEGENGLGNLMAMCRNCHGMKTQQDLD